MSSPTPYTVDQLVSLELEAEAIDRAHTDKWLWERRTGQPLPLGRLPPRHWPECTRFSTALAVHSIFDRVFLSVTRLETEWRQVGRKNYPDTYRVVWNEAKDVLENHAEEAVTKLCAKSVSSHEFVESLLAKKRFAKTAQRILTEATKLKIRAGIEAKAAANTNKPTA